MQLIHKVIQSLCSWILSHNQSLENHVSNFTSFFIVVDSFALAQAPFIKRINDESSSFAFARLLIFSHATSIDGELRISSNLACAVSNVSTLSRVLSYALTADKHLVPSLAIAAQQIGQSNKTGNSRKILKYSFGSIIRKDLVWEWTFKSLIL